MNLLEGRISWPFALLAISAALGSLGMAASGVAGSLLAIELTGSSAASGLPLGSFTVGAVIGAVFVSRRAATAGRVSGLAAGYAIGAVGALGVVGSAWAGIFVGVLMSLVLMGFANASIFLTRYAGAAMVTADRRAIGLGLVLAATAGGAIVGPMLLEPTAGLATAIGAPAATGLFLLTVPAFAAAAIVVRAAAHGDSGPLTRPSVEPGVGRSARALLDLARTPQMRRPLRVLAASNLVMVGVMAIIPVHLTHHGQGMEGIGWMISLHLLGMLGPSPASGWLADRFGGGAVAAVGAVLMALSSALLLVADPAATLLVVEAVVLLGVGWNFGIVGGSAMIAADASAADRADAEGLGEVSLGIAATIGATTAGVGLAIGGLEFVALAAIVVTVATFAWEVLPAAQVPPVRA